MPPPVVVHTACLTHTSNDGEVASCLEKSPVPLAQRPKEPIAVDCSPCRIGTVATVRACSQSSSDSVSEYPICLEQSPLRRTPRALPPPSNAGATPARKCAKTELGTKTGPLDSDAQLATVQRTPLKANANRDLPTIKSVKLRLLPDQFVARACFFYSVAQSMHAVGNDSPL